MPKYPNFSPHLSQMVGSVFEKFRAKMTAQGDNLVRFHLGDTYQPTAYNLPVADEFLADHPGANRYCDTFGVAELRHVLAEKLRDDNQFNVKKDHILMTAGATNALSCTLGALLEPGDEILVLTPVPSFGIAKANRMTVREVPFYERLFADPELDLAEYLTPFITEKTCLIYLNSPNNPSGKMLNREQLQAVAEVAQQHDLWVLSDEAYDGLVFDGEQHTSIATLPGMFERTVSVFTFSKSFMFAGLRLGYAVASEPVIGALNKILVHQLYSPSTIAQQMMIQPVRTRHEWLPEVRAHYQQCRDQFVDELAVEVNVPEAGYFIFFSVGEEGVRFVERCIEAGVAAAPGGDFGADFKQHVRVCFTAETPDRLSLGVERLNRVLGQR